MFHTLMHILHGNLHVIENKTLKLRPMFQWHQLLSYNHLWFWHFAPPFHFQCLLKNKFEWNTVLHSVDFNTFATIIVHFKETYCLFLSCCKHHRNNRLQNSATNYWNDHLQWSTLHLHNLYLQLELRRK